MKESKLSTISDVIILIILYFIFLCAIIADKYTIMGNYIFENTFSNFNIDPIVDIDISRWRCRDGYNPLFNHSYPGHYSACYDPITKDYRLEKNENECKENENFLEKVDITPMNGWKEKVICIKRESFKNNSYISPRGIDCKDGYKYCGYADSFEDKYCVEKERDCPIFFFEINKKDTYNSTEKEIKSHVLNDEYSLFYSNNSTKILNKGVFMKIDFSVASKYPCIRADRISPFGEEYPLMLEESKKKYGCKPSDAEKWQKTVEEYYDGNYNNPDILLYSQRKKKSNINETKFFDFRYKPIDFYDLNNFDNDNDMEFLNELPIIKNFTPNTNITIKLYSRSYIYPNITCLKNSTEKFFEIENMYKDLKFDNFLLNIYILGNLLILCIFISVISLMKITSKTQNLILSLLKIITCLILLILISKQVSLIQKGDYNMRDIYTNINQDYCLDEVTKTTLKNVFYVTETFFFKQRLMKTIYYTIFVYLAFIIIQFLKFWHKVYLRFNEQKRGNTTKDVIDFVIEN